MFDIERHLEDLTGHIGMVRDAGLKLGGRLIDQGRTDFGRLLIARCHTHDASKFYGVEWDYLHVGPDVDKTMLLLAIKQHTSTNSHHPEFHGGVANMPELDVAEMVCDCYARSQERGTAIREWFTKEAVQKYNIDLEGRQWKWINNFLDLLLLSSFK